jgi:hypothetical protein
MVATSSRSPISKPRTSSPSKWITWQAESPATCSPIPRRRGPAGQRLIEAIYESARTGRSVKLAPPPTPPAAPKSNKVKRGQAKKGYLPWIHSTLRVPLETQVEGQFTGFVTSVLEGAIFGTLHGVFPESTNSRKVWTIYGRLPGSDFQIRIFRLRSGCGYADGDQIML